MIDRKNQDMHVPRPKIGPFEINLNTLVVVAGFVFTWGVTYSQLESGRSTNAENISRLEVRMTNLEATSRVLENHEQRITVVEREARDAATNTRQMQDTMGRLVTDIAVIKEILVRQDQMNGSGRN